MAEKIAMLFRTCSFDGLAVIVIRPERFGKSRGGLDTVGYILDYVWFCLLDYASLARAIFLDIISLQVEVDFMFRWLVRVEFSVMVPFFRIWLCFMHF